MARTFGKNIWQEHHLQENSRTLAAGSDGNTANAIWSPRTSAMVLSMTVANYECNQHTPTNNTWSSDLGRLGWQWLNWQHCLVCRLLSVTVTSQPLVMY
ncbi:hypothetical protein J6590_011304 [Homalodisca vitripennis]|nr:hypothetical protein J6590_011304 [Homalodisca vitripennis]